MVAFQFEFQTWKLTLPPKLSSERDSFEIHRQQILQNLEKVNQNRFDVFKRPD